MSHNALIGCYGCLKRRLFKAREEVREGGDLSAGGSDAPTADDRWAAPAEARRREAREAVDDRDRAVRRVEAREEARDRALGVRNVSEERLIA